MAMTPIKNAMILHFFQNYVYDEYYYELFLILMCTLNYIMSFSGLSLNDCYVTDANPLVT